MKRMRQAWLKLCVLSDKAKRLAINLMVALGQYRELATKQQERLDKWKHLINNVALPLLRINKQPYLNPTGNTTSKES